MLHFEINEAGPYCQYNIDHCFKPHRHTFYQVIWFKSSGKHYVDYQVLYHNKDTILFIDKNQLHYFCSDSENKGVLFHFDDVFISKYVLSAEKRFLYTLFSGIGDRCINLGEVDTIRLNQLVSILKEEMLEKKKFFQQQIALVFQSFLLILERLKSDTQATSTNDPLRDLAVTFKRAVQAQLSEFKSLDDYAQGLNTNIKKLTLASKKYFNDTPNAIIHLEKLLESKRLLLNSNLTIQEIAYSLGYDQPTYFIKVFKKFYKMTPKAFRDTIV